jgi:[ribosomal protein S5]-alanine N-acetyltransferase
VPQTLNFPNTVPDLFAETMHLRELTEDDIPAWFARAIDVESADLAGDPIPGSIEMGAA